MRRIANIAISILAIASFVVAQPGRPPKRDAPPDQLNLTSEQKRQWEALHRAFEVSSRPLRDKLDAAHGRIEASSDPCTIGGLVLDARQVHEQLEAQHQALDAKLESVLTTEQKTKFEAFRAAAALIGRRP